MHGYKNTMKIVERAFTKEEAQIGVVPEDIDDIYALYQMVERGDKIKSATTRNVSAEEGKAKARVCLVLEVQADGITVDLAVGILFVKGKILNETNHTKIGTFHTLEIPVHQKVCIRKAKIADEEIRALESLTLGNKAETLYVICRKEGYALVLSSEYTTKRIAAVQKEKKKGQVEKTVQEIAKHAKASVKLVIVIGDEALVADQMKKMQEFKNKILFVKKAFTSENTSAGDAEAIRSAIRLPEVEKQMCSMRYGKEIAAANEFFTKEEGSLKGTSTGQKEVQCAAENYLVKKLIVVDACVKSKRPEERVRISEVLALVRKTGAEIHVLSQYTPLGEKILQRGGIVAILTQPVLIADFME